MRPEGQLSLLDLAPTVDRLVGSLVWLVVPWRIVAVEGDTAIGENTHYGRIRMPVDVAVARIEWKAANPSLSDSAAIRQRTADWWGRHQHGTVCPWCARPEDGGRYWWHLPERQWCTLCGYDSLVVPLWAQCTVDLPPGAQPPPWADRYPVRASR